MEKLFEAMNLDIYKKLLRILSDYVKNMPMAGMSRLFDQAVEHGMKILPKDKTALDILDFVLDEDNIASSVQDLLNMRFSCVPAACIPLVKNAKPTGRKREIAFWTRGKLISDKVKDLINWDNGGGTGFWSDADGKKVSLIDMSKENKENK